MEHVKKALNLGLFIHADGLDEIEWSVVVDHVSNGRA